MITPEALADQLDALSRQVASLQSRFASQEQAALEAALSPADVLRVGSFPSGAEVYPAGTTTPGSENIIATGAITADTISAGAVTAEKVSVGALPVSRNLVANGGFREGNAVGWSLVQNTDTTAVLADWFSDATWTLRDGDVDSWNASAGPFGSSVSIQSTAATTKEPYLLSDLFPVVAGGTYSCSARVGTHRATGAYLVVWWYDSAAAYLSATATATVTDLSKQGGSELGGWSHLTLEGLVAPTTARSAKVALVLVTPYTSGTDCFLFADQVWFGAGPKALPYQPGEITNVHNSDGNVVIDSTGVTITNGALTFEDAYGSTAMNGDGFGASWVDFIKTNLFNSSFQYGALGAIAGTEIPNWTAVLSSATAALVADATAPCGRTLEVTPTALNGKLTLTSAMVPVSPFTGLTVSIRTGWTVAAGSTANIYVEIQTYEADETTVVNAWASANFTPIGTAANVAISKNYGTSFYLGSGKERYMQMRVVLQEIAAHSASTRLRLNQVAAPTNIEFNALTSWANVLAPGGVQTAYKAGTFSDADFPYPSVPADGLIGIDGTNHRIYFREGGGLALRQPDGRVSDPG